jgi:choline dehydrogenase-like flavoprotein
MGVCTYFLPDNLNEKNKINYHNNNFEINYFESEEKKHLSNRIEKRIKKYLLKMSAIPIKTIKYNSGAAIHYAGTIPMGNNDAYPVNSKGEVKFIKNLVISDSSAFPNLPSKPVSANAASYGIYTAKYNI